MLMFKIDIQNFVNRDWEISCVATIEDYILLSYK